MNNLQLFFKINIRETGFFAKVGNFFLAPARFFFLGKSIIIERDLETGKLNPNGNIAKVSSFYITDNDYFGESEINSHKHSKQTTELKSEPLGGGPVIIFTPLLLFVALIPFTIIRSIFKIFSYFGAEALQAHALVKKKLTYQELVEIGSDAAPVNNSEELLDRLNNIVKSGQKIDSLILHAKEENMNDACLIAIKNINPLKLILVGNWNKDNFKIYQQLTSITNDRTTRKRQNWNLEALNLYVPADNFD